MIAGVFVAGLLVFSYLTDIRNIREKQEAQQKAALTERDSQPGTDQVAKPIDHETGLVIAPGFNLVKTNCLGCHSAKLITQNKASRATWKATILWMQETQNLWNLGENEPKILDYLAKHYAPGRVGRRMPLADIEWYELQE